MENLDSSVGDANVKDLFDELKRGGVKTLVSDDVIIGAKAVTAPGRELEGLGRQAF